MDRSVRLLLAACFLWFGASACGQSFISSNTQAGDDQEKVDQGEPPSGPTKFVIAPAGAKKHDVMVGRTANLKVFVLNKSTGEAAAEEVVSYSVESGKELGSMATSKARTDENGAAAVRFRAGQQIGEATVEVSHPKAESVTFTLTVQPEPTGKLSLQLVNTGSSVMSLKDVTVQLYNGDELDCAGFAPLASQGKESLRTKMRDRAGTTVEFGALATDKDYTVTAVARGDRGQIAAGGCQEDIRIPGDRVVEEELLLHLVPLNPTGRYRATSYYDFSNALKDSGIVGNRIVTVLNIFENPGDAIYNEIIDLVKNLVGDLVGSGFDTLLDKTGLDDKFKGMINDAVQNNETLCKIREIGRDVRDVIASLEIESELTIGKLRSDYEFRGRDNWLSMTMYWRAKCDGAIDEVCSKDEDPGSDEVDRKKPCAAIHLVPEDTEGDVGDIGVWSSEWRGRLTSYNHLTVRRHPMPLRYGKLIQYILKQVVIPELTDGNANSLSDAFAYWLGCDSLGTSITGSDGEVCALDQCIEDDDISGFCKTAVSTLFGAADLAIGELKFDTGIYIGGEAELVETSSDGRVDYIEDGTWEGYVEVTDKGNTQGRSNISGVWSAERLSSRSVSQ